MTRGWVVISRARLCAPLLMLGMGLFVNVQLPPDGNPDPHANETDSGNPEPVAVAVTLYVAGTPASTVAVAGEAMTQKSLTVADPGAFGPGPALKAPILLIGN